MNDIRPPKRVTPRPTGAPRPNPELETPPLETQKAFEPALAQEPVLTEGGQDEHSNKTGLGQKKRFGAKKILLGVVGALLLLVVAGFLWYQYALSPVNSSDTTKKQVEIVEGSSPADIADTLHEKGLIRNQVAFDIYTRLSKTRSSLQAGSYSLSPSQSTPDIVAALAGGKVDKNELVITFVPGAMLYDKSDKPENKKQDIFHTLKRAGYDDAEILAAFNKTYDYPELFADKPANANIEGYVYGDTYHFDKGTPVEQILARTFDEFTVVLKENNLKDAFKAQGLNLYEGITLSSIVQRELSSQDANTPTKDQKQVAQVFYLRLTEDMPLGSDVTYHYAADKDGLMRDFTLDSPYNTRKHAGLPPGPIAAPGLGAMLATAHPAPGKYLYFLSGDDDVTYFAYTQQQHDKNILDHCKQKCLLP